MVAMVGVVVFVLADSVINIGNGIVVMGKRRFILYFSIQLVGVWTPYILLLSNKISINLFLFTSFVLLLFVSSVPLYMPSVLSPSFVELQMLYRVEAWVMVVTTLPTGHPSRSPVPLNDLHISTQI